MQTFAGGRRSALLALPFLLLLLLCASAGAAPMQLVGGALEVRLLIVENDDLGGPGSVVMPLGAPQAVSVSPGGSFSLPSSIFGPATITLTRGLTTGVPLLSGAQFTGVANDALAFDGATGTGVGALQGTALLNLAIGVLDLVIPLTPVGVPGATAVGNATGVDIGLQVFGQGWTSGVAVVTAVTTTAPGGTALVNTVSLAGSDARTPGGAGSLTLVSGFRAVSVSTGALAGFAIQTLVFEAPEPAPLSFALLASAALLATGLLRRRR